MNAQPVHSGIPNIIGWKNRAASYGLRASLKSKYRDQAHECAVTKKHPFTPWVTGRAHFAQPSFCG
jgi:hypothetical protein